MRTICELRTLKLHAVAVAGRGPLLSPFSVSCRPSSHLFPERAWSVFLRHRFHPCKSRVRKLDYRAAPPSLPPCSHVSESLSLSTQTDAARGSPVPSEFIANRSSGAFSTGCNYEHIFLKISLNSAGKWTRSLVTLVFLHIFV